MTMTEPARKLPPRPQRLGVAEAKSRLSELLRHTADGPTIIHSRGRDVAVVLAIEDYDRLVAEHDVGSGGGAQFLERVEILKQRHGGGVEDFAPAPMVFQPVDPFARKKSGARR
jgi:prevent-host-death family protein